MLLWRSHDLILDSIFAVKIRGYFSCSIKNLELLFSADYFTVSLIIIFLIFSNYRWRHFDALETYPRTRHRRLAHGMHCLFEWFSPIWLCYSSNIHHRSTKFVSLTIDFLKEITNAIAVWVIVWCTIIKEVRVSIFVISSLSSLIISPNLVQNNNSEIQQIMFVNNSPNK